jgi:Anti-sigma-28 factor, FlgM
MRIHDVNLTGAQAAESGRAQEALRVEREGGISGTAGAGNANTDHIEFSDTLNSLGRAMSAYSSNRAAKVQALAAQYRSGAYSADSQATSRAMVADALAGAGQ